MTWSLNNSLATLSRTCGSNTTLTPALGASGSVILTATVNWGVYGTRQVSKTINLSSATIAGTFNYTGTTQNFALQPAPQPNIVCEGRWHCNV